MRMQPNEDRAIKAAIDGILLNFILTETLNKHAITSLMARKKKLSVTSSPKESIVKANPK